MTRPGDVDLTINGEPHKMRLTLGALADIERALGGDLEAVKQRLARPRISDIIQVVHALIGGGGGALTLKALVASDLDLGAATTAIAKAFDALDAEAPGKPQAPAPSKTEEG